MSPGRLALAPNPFIWRWSFGRNWRSSSVIGTVSETVGFVPPWNSWRFVNSPLS
ncbi:MAG TPA: hypothetical protein P5534_17945 [Candidatus Paceibacterota bacterium]|nr:hypothetical protein [Candidatus Paceibacterota bacterium]HRZ56650.1 hypothetical protein [Candidatus Paceibacterota bacterium]